MNEETNAKAWAELHLMRQRLASLEQHHAAELATLRLRLSELESLLSPALESASVVAEEVAPVPVTIAKPAYRPMETVQPASPPPYPAPAAERKPAERAPLELRFGRVWLVRIGIALLLTGFVLLGNFAYQNWIRDLPPGIRLAALYLGSLALSGAGVHYAKRENLRRFGEVLLAGGLAFFYWCTFASHHVARLQVVDSPVIAGAMLLAVAGGIVAIALRRDSRAVAVMGLLFASYATVLQPLGWLSTASNLVLAIAGIGLMTRREWGAPGIVAMAGTYLSFLWWQTAGAAGGPQHDAAALYFLPPVWAVFALPGITGITRYFPGLSAQARGWFLTINNGAFFALFSAVWIEQKGSADYWMVPAVFGFLLATMGVLARRSDRASGESQLAQGLVALTLAMVLKLEGDTLAIGLAVQALLTAIAYARYGGRVELVASSLAALAGALYLILWSGLGREIADWNRALAAFLIMSSVAPLYLGWQRHGPAWEAGQPARAATSLSLAAGSLALLLGWCLYLEDGTRYLCVLGIGTAMSAAALLLDRQGRLRELGTWSLVFHAAALLLIVQAHPFSWIREKTMLAGWWPATALLMGVAGHWLWVHRAPARREDDKFPIADFSAIVTASIIVVALHTLVIPLDLTTGGRMLVSGLIAIALAAGGRFLLVSPLLIAASVFFLGEIVFLQVSSSPIPWPAEFLPLLIAGGITWIAYRPQRYDISDLAAAAARTLAVLSWIAAWVSLAPDAWADVIAASSLLLLLAPGSLGRGRLPEAWALVGVAMAWLAARMATAPWHAMDTPPSAEGWMVAITLLTIPFVARLPQPDWRNIRPLVIMAGAALLAAWCTQTMVWHLGWKPVAIAWTVLGFTMVSAGLWQKVAALRHVGFALLGFAVLKLFVVDVWDFATFFRVTAFLSLGVALVVLGFFYNRFADVLKKLLDSREI
ncbi:DUF2339 domain-containing protein [Luteolibacter sp. GHJ8]|uniref:DUF2339 domain-containing protein n=1 Tax=Luteolibacter rhizosphaerae TaxID=2989719 RepID=A0ABT3G200_9BACT|nr:DUF2339 domain-containing protein [Luteolibacter rhizosphaerae]MCW1913529.1 DUF2339 domain-containing protein [Luteolibacter rhizosphaerae]